MLMYWYARRNGVFVFARPHPTSSVRTSVANTPNIARFADDRRVRTLVSAMRKAVSGTMRIAGTAHPSVFAGSKVKPEARDPEAAVAMLVRT
jgi:hypothetical protein